MSTNNHQIDVKFCQPCNKNIKKSNLSRHNRSPLHTGNLRVFSCEGRALLRVAWLPSNDPQLSAKKEPVNPAKFNPDEEYMFDSDLKGNIYKDEKCCNTKTWGFPCNICNRPSKLFLENNPVINELPINEQALEYGIKDIQSILEKYSVNKKKITIIFE
jgi:hypothetical protein